MPVNLFTSLSSHLLLVKNCFIIFCHTNVSDVSFYGVLLSRDKSDSDC